jgi:hypothetical protein
MSVRLDQDGTLKVRAEDRVKFATMDDECRAVSVVGRMNHWP